MSITEMAATLLHSGESIWSAIRWLLLRNDESKAIGEALTDEEFHVWITNRAPRFYSTNCLINIPSHKHLVESEEIAKSFYDLLWRDFSVELNSTLAPDMVSYDEP